MQFIIREDTKAGFYLHVYENGIDKYDHLQDTLEIAKKQAFEDFGVPYDAWKQVED